MLGRTPQGPFGFTSQNRDITRDICKEDGLGLVGETAGCRDQSPLCPIVCAGLRKNSFTKHLLFHLLVNCLPPLWSPKPPPLTSSFVFHWRWYLRWGFPSFGKSPSFSRFLPRVHVIKILFDFSPVNLSHVNLIIRPAPKILEGREKFLPSQEH